MARWIAPLIPLLFLAASDVHAADIRTETVTYTVEDTEMQGFLAYDAEIEGERPGVLVVHEWWGLNEPIRDRARMLAEQGYTALALDMYGDGRVAEHPDDAGAMAGEVRQNMERMTRRFQAAEQQLRTHPTVDADQLAAIGYCFGGGVVLEMARQGADLEAVASFHGTLATDSPAQPGEIQADVLVLHGEEDRMVTDEDVEAFKQEMEAAEVDYRFVSYPNAMHGFTNPEADGLGERFGIPLAYDASADQQSWTELMRFFESTLER